MNETIVLNPREFVPEFTEVGLDELGIGVRADGADWGESRIQANMIRRASGEVPVDPYRTNVEMSVPLKVLEDGAVTLAEASHRLQAAIGRAQDEPTWIRRDFDDEGRFAGSVAYQIWTPSLAGLQGWLFAHRRVAPDVVLKAMRSPLCYATVEITSEEFSETSERELIFELAEVLGTAPGLIRLTITNDNASDDWRGCIVAMESRDMAQDATKDTTAALAYEAEKLTLLGGSTTAANGGASGSGNNIVLSPTLSNSWQVILGSRIAGVGEMTHVGTRRVWLRISAATEVELRLEWRSLGQTDWTQNRIASSSFVGGFFLIDLGECRLDAATLGDQRWEWRVTARTTGAAGKRVPIDKVYVLPTEQFLATRKSIALVTPITFLSRDEFDQAAGNLAGKTAPIGGTWVGAGSAKGDFTVNATDHLAQRAVVDDISLNDGRYLTVGTAIDLCAVQADIYLPVSARTATGGQFGLLARYVDVNNWAFFGWQYAPENPRASIHMMFWKRVAGAASGYLLPVQSAGVWRTASFAIYKSGAYACFVDGEFVHGGVDTVFGSGGALARGTAGLYDVGGAGDGTRKYDNFTTWAPELDALCFAGRSIEFRSDGVYRQHPTDDVWGRVTAEGFLPYAPPSGLEGRAARGIIIPTQGDLGQLPDGGTNRLSATASVRPGYAFAREAAS